MATASALNSSGNDRRVLGMPFFSMVAMITSLKR
ncbi:MAG: hypothetical protein ACI8Y4_000978 [Candidatus Poriferisodalaceae bacterium]